MRRPVAAPGAAEIAAAALGLAGPVVAGVAGGRPELGFAACIGALMVGSVAPGRGFREQSRALGAVLLPAAAATVLAALLAARGGAGDAIAVVAIGIAAVAGGSSRDAAAAATRFALYLLIAMAAAGSLPRSWDLVPLVGAGAAWSALLSLGAGAVARMRGPDAATNDAPPPAAAMSRGERRARWRRSLREARGWQYVLRLTACLAAAMAASSLWPGHHLHWIALTVALLTERPLDAPATKVRERAFGTLLGVLVAGLLFHAAMPAAMAAGVVAVLGAARAALRTRSYLAYTAVTTPLILALLDTGAPTPIAVLVDRFAATIAGAALVLAAGTIARRVLRSSSV